MKDDVLRIGLRDWFAIAEKLFGKDRRLWRFKCVACGHVQTAEDLIALGVPADEAEGACYFNCAGRYAKKPPPAALSPAATAGGGEGRAAPRRAREDVVRLYLTEASVA